MRTCVGCRRRRPIGELARVVRDPGGSLVVGRGLPGRGAWLCRGSTACIDRAVATKAFDRALRARLEDDQVDRDRLRAGASPAPTRIRGSEGSGP